MSIVRQTQLINNFYEPENNPLRKRRNIEEASRHLRYTPTNNSNFPASVEDESTSREGIEIKGKMKERMDAFCSEIIKNKINFIDISKEMGHAKGWFSHLVAANSSTCTITRGKLEKLEKVVSKLLGGTTVNLSDLSKSMFIDRVENVIVPSSDISSITQRPQQENNKSHLVSSKDVFPPPVRDKSTEQEKIEIKGEMNRRINTLRCACIESGIPITSISIKMGHSESWLSGLKPRGSRGCTITRKNLEKLEKVASEAFGMKSVNLSDLSKPLFIDRVTSVSNNPDGQAQGTKRKWGHISEIVEKSIPQAVVIPRNSRSGPDAGDFFSDISMDPDTEQEIEASRYVFIEDD